MYSVINSIKEFVATQFGSDFHIEVLPFKTQTRDPFEKKTKNRFDLRTLLYNFLKEKKNFIFEDVLDLRNVPQKIATPNKDYYSSLSHTEEIGVFVLDSSPIGVDYEHRDRIKKDIVKRVSQDRELELHSNFQLLWSIKEAAFKAIPFIVQPKTVSEIFVDKISPEPNARVSGFDVFSFSAHTQSSPEVTVSGFGITNSENQMVIAKALIKK